MASRWRLGAGGRLTLNIPILSAAGESSSSLWLGLVTAVYAPATRWSDAPVLTSRDAHLGRREVRVAAGGLPFGTRPRSSDGDLQADPPHRW